MNLRQTVERHLAITLEGLWALPIILVAPDGSVQPVTGQINYETITVNPDTGEEIVTNNPNVSVRVTTLTRVPVDGERWVVRIPTAPTEGAEIVDFMLSPTRPIEGGRSIGFLRLYLRKARQS